MISILDLTTSDAVRATLGVDEEELSDQVFVDADLQNELVIDLSEWVPSTISVEDIVSDGESADQGSQEHLQYARLSSYAKAFCALFLLVSGDNWRLIRLTDGNVDERRRSDTDMEALQEYLNGLLNKHRIGFLDLVENTDTTISFGIFGVSSLTSDPVTGA